MILASRMKKVPLLFRSADFRRKQYRKAVLANFQRNFDNVRYFGIDSGSEIIFTYTQDRYLTRNLALRAYPTRQNLLAAVAVCEENGLNLSKVFLDVGANVGTETVYALKLNRFSKALCFEPAPENLRLLNLNVLVNGLQDKVEIHPFAVSQASGFVELELSQDNPGDHRVVARTRDTALPDMFGESTRKKIQVRCTTLDEALAQSGINVCDISLLWMDTQGHEGLILSGAKRILAENVPVMLEFWPYGLIRTGTLELLCEIIRENFRSCYTISEGIPSRKLDTRVVHSIAERLTGTVTYEDLLLIK
jgi:FkbM family methyltransferase